MFLSLTRELNASHLYRLFMDKWIALKIRTSQYCNLMVGHNHEDIEVGEAEGEFCTSSKEMGRVFLQLVQRHCKPLRNHLCNFASPRRNKQS